MPAQEEFVLSFASLRQTLAYPSTRWRCECVCDGESSPGENAQLYSSDSIGYPLKKNSRTIVLCWDIPPHNGVWSNGEVCPRLRILPFLFCSTTQGFLLFYLSLDSPSQVPLLLRYSDSLPRLSHLGPAFSFLILHSRFLRFLSDSLGQPEPIPDSAPPSRFSCLSSYS